MPHTDSLLRTALRILKEGPAAEDLVQETLLRAWRAFDQFERGTNCKAWLFRIMLNICNKNHRLARARSVVVPFDDGTARVISLQARPSQVTTLEVASALDSLSDQHRLVLIMAVVEGFTCKEIAQICSVPIGTVMSRLSRGRAELREKLSRPEETEQSKSRAC